MRRKSQIYDLNILYLIEAARNLLARTIQLRRMKCERLANASGQAYSILVAALRHPDTLASDPAPNMARAIGELRAPVATTVKRYDFEAREVYDDWAARAVESPTGEYVRYADVAPTLAPPILSTPELECIRAALAFWRESLHTQEIFRADGELSREEMDSLIDRLNQE